MDYTICVNTYKDQHLLTRLKGQVALHCSCPFLIVSDGVLLEDQFKDSIWFEFPRAKANGQKGLWTKRYLELYLQHTTTSHLLRVDPDTCIWKPFVLPVGEYDIFGTISPDRYKYPYVRGGCIGFTRTCAQKILDSGLLLDDKYLEYNYQRYLHHRWDHEEKSDEKFAFQDWIVGDIAYKLKLKLKEWEDILILGNQKIIPEKGNFCITHPHPILD